jgi:hypothetical protein
MSTTDEVNFDAPVPKKKAAKKKAKVAAPAKSTAPFPGMTRTACADACNAKGCAISQKPYCAHPVKGGLQSADQNDPAALKRLERARAQLDVRLDPDRFK